MTIRITLSQDVETITLRGVLHDCGLSGEK